MVIVTITDRLICARHLRAARAGVYTNWRELRASLAYLRPVAPSNGESGRFITSTYLGVNLALNVNKNISDNGFGWRRTINMHNAELRRKLLHACGRSTEKKKVHLEVTIFKQQGAIIPFR